MASEDAVGADYTCIPAACCVTRPVARVSQDHTEDIPMIRLQPVPTLCETCRFWQPDDYPEDTVLGECRVHAPEFNPLPGDPQDADTLAGLPRRPWPMTESRDWCSQWRA